VPYKAGRHRFPDPETRRQHLQVVNVYVQAQTDLTPASQAPAEQLREAMSPLLVGQTIPLLGEPVTLDDDPNLRDL
jgi:hypothetical protein